MSSGEVDVDDARLGAEVQMTPCSSGTRTQLRSETDLTGKVRKQTSPGPINQSDHVVRSTGQRNNPGLY